MNASIVSTSKESGNTMISSPSCAIIERMLCRMEDEKNVTFLELFKEDALEIPIKGENVQSSTLFQRIDINKLK